MAKQVCCLVFALAIVLALRQAAGARAPRPDPKNAAVFSRWLLNQSSWGVLTTLAVPEGYPFGNVMSVSDGGTGTPYFYLAEKSRDPTAGYAQNDSRASFTLSEFALRNLKGIYCNRSVDPQAPVCAKLTFSGRLEELGNNPKEAAIAEATLFTNHPQLAGWPKYHDFSFYKLVITKIFLVNDYASAKNVTVYDYYNPKM